MRRHRQRLGHAGDALSIPARPTFSRCRFSYIFTQSLTDTAMFGPGAYRPDPTEGITAIADLPPPEIVPSSRTYTRQACPRCGHQAYRDKQFQRTLHDLGNLDLWCPRDLVVTYS